MKMCLKAENSCYCKSKVALRCIIASEFFRWTIWIQRQNGERRLWLIRSNVSASPRVSPDPGPGLETSCGGSLLPWLVTGSGRPPRPALWPLSLSTPHWFSARPRSGRPWSAARLLISSSLHTGSRSQHLNEVGVPSRSRPRLVPQLSSLLSNL